MRWQIDKHAQIARAANADRGRRDCRGQHHQQAHGQTEPRLVERLLDISGFAGANWHARPKLGKGCRAERHDYSCEDESQRRVHATSTRSNAHQHVDASADRHAEPIEHGEQKRQRTLQLLGWGRL